MRKKYFRWIIPLLLSYSFIFMPLSGKSGVGDEPATLALHWYHLEMKLVSQKAGCTPPVVARIIGYSGIVLYETLVNGLPGYQSLAPVLQIPGMPAPDKKQQYNWQACANAGMAWYLKKMIVNLSARDSINIDGLKNYFATQFSNHCTPREMEASVKLGEQIVDAIVSWAQTDGAGNAQGNNFKLMDHKTATIGGWIPTIYAGAMQPDWGKVRPFLQENTDVCLLPKPPPYTLKKRSALYKEAKQVWEVSKKLTAEQADIARFWADPTGRTCTPAGHSVSILCQIMEREKLNLGQAAIALAKLGIALHDAFIACWKAKYEFYYIRPITYIRNKFEPYWLTFLETPSFPEYPSGHSVQSGAMAEILTSIFGRSYKFTDNTHDSLGYPARTFSSFYAAAEEAAYSRLYGGIHFKSAIVNGLDQGRRIGRNVNRRLYFQSSR